MPLEELPDDRRATEIVAALMRRLWRPVSTEGDLIPLEKWTAGLKRLRAAFDSGSGPFPEEMVRRAEGLFAGLNGSSPESVLLHGDLHYWNILSAGKRALAGDRSQGRGGRPRLRARRLAVEPQAKGFGGARSAAPA